jgi:hypothetical protein
MYNVVHASDAVDVSCVNFNIDIEVKIKKKVLQDRLLNDFPWYNKAYFPNAFSRISAPHCPNF